MKTTLLLLTLCGTLLVEGSPSPQNTDTSLAARELWERVLQAKGGRDQLNRIDNLLVTGFSPRDLEHPTGVDLFIFPNKRWLWSDNGETVLGTSLWVTDETGTWEAYYHPRNRIPRGTAWGPPNDLLKYRVLELHTDFLLETKWLKPVPLRVRVGRIGREEFDVVSVDYGTAMRGSSQYEYYVDKKTFLVRRIVWRNVTTDFQDYRPIEGIMMPSRVTYVGKPTVSYSPEFAFNVAYDPEIFKRKPSLDDGPNGWKLRPAEPQLLPGRVPKSRER